MPLVAVVCVEANWDSGRLSVETGVGVTVGDEATDFVVNGPWVAVSLLELELAAGAGRTAVDCVVDCAAPEEVSVGGRETPVDEVAVVDVSDSNAAVPPVTVALGPEGAGDVVSSSDRSPSLSTPESIPESMSSPSAACTVDPRPVGRA